MLLHKVENRAPVKHNILLDHLNSRYPKVAVQVKVDPSSNETVTSMLARRGCRLTVLYIQSMNDVGADAMVDGERFCQLPNQCSKSHEQRAVRIL